MTRVQVEFDSDELAAVGAGLEGRLARALEGLKSYGPADLERDIGEFARSEVEVEDPLQARLVESGDAYGPPGTNSTRAPG